MPARTPTVAATILLVRPDPDGLRVFMVKRHRKSGFMPDAWVFPGGRVEGSDAEVPASRCRGGDDAIAQLGYGDDGRAVLVGGVRETFEESGIWLGDGELPVASRDPLARGEITLASLLDAHDATLDLDALHPWARSITPVGEKRRFDTAFLLVISTEEGGAHDASETVASGWFTPSEVLSAGMGTMGLAPPTWWALTELARCGDRDELEAELARRTPRPVQPVLRMDEETVGILLPGHAEHPEPRRADLPVRIVLTPDGWVADG